MRTSASRKSEFLGMPHGTAANRLRKQIMFQLLKRLGENVCFKCAQEIVSADDLSIEHKQPWEGVSVELFWSMENIAFSHRGCNLPHVYRGGGVSKRKNGAAGTAWCVGCQEFLSVTKFSRNRSRWNGLQNHCDDCLRAIRLRHAEERKRLSL